MSAARYVLTISAGSAESLTAHAHGLAGFLSGDPRSGRRAFAGMATLPGVAATLLNFRRSAPHRLALSAATVAEAADKLAAFTDQGSNPGSPASQGLYVNVVHWSAFDEDTPDDRDYLRALATSARHDQLAKLWSVGFPVDWRHVYPELAAERPVYLPPAPLHRRRYWPETPAPQEVVTTEPAVVAQPVNEPSLIAELTDLPTTLRVRRLSGYLQDHIGALLGYPPGERPHTGSGFFDLGMSSIHIGQVRQFIIDDLAFEPGETSAFDHPTIAEFAAYLARGLAQHTEGEPLLLHTLGQDDIDRLSAHDLERTLAEVLS
jgi:hypothetical protein